MGGGWGGESLGLTANIAICVDEPMATPREMSCKHHGRDKHRSTVQKAGASQSRRGELRGDIWLKERRLAQKDAEEQSWGRGRRALLSLMANMTEEACSAALPTMGRMMTLMKGRGRPQLVAAPCGERGQATLRPSAEGTSTLALCAQVCHAKSTQRAHARPHALRTKTHRNSKHTIKTPGEDTIRDT